MHASSTSLEIRLKCENKFKINFIFKIWKFIYKIFLSLFNFIQYFGIKNNLILQFSNNQKKILS